jgi:hypothetical protein
MELSVGYLVAAILTGGLLFLALRNQKQGWRKPSGDLAQTQSEAAVTSVESGLDSSLQHSNDLTRLQRSVAAENHNAQKEQVAVSKVNFSPYTLQHWDDLTRLQRSLAAENQNTQNDQKEQIVASKVDLLPYTL